MYCIGCGAENIESSAHCIRCGRDLMNLRGENSSKPMEEKVVKKSKANWWWWPDVTTIESATKATRQGMWAAVFVAAVTAIFATVAANSGDIKFGTASISPWALIDSAIFAAVAFGLYKKSRVAAVAGLVIFGLEKLDQITSAGTVGNIFIAVIIALCFIGAVRGTYALHRFRVESNG
jgi:hypothetical protein